MKAVDDPFPLDLRFLKVDEEADAAAGGFQIVQALGGVLGGEMVDAFQFDE